MGHSNFRIFKEYYLLQRVRNDVQVAYLGRPSKDVLIEAAS